MTGRPARSAPPAFLFFGVFSSRREIIEEAGRLAVRRYGPLHESGESRYFPFPDTRTYRESMGAGLEKKFFVMKERWPQDGLAAVKRDAIDIETLVGERWSGEMGLERPVNVDPGLINDCRVILATTKDHAHRIYRGDGIWEEITLVFRDGAYRSMPWTYRDFENAQYHVFFEKFREEIIRERKS